ncbi:translation elongation factor domain protein, partial [Vibrio parahaemolyticus IDH02640]
QYRSYRVYRFPTA